MKILKDRFRQIYNYFFNNNPDYITNHYSMLNINDNVNDNEHENEHMSDNEYEHMSDNEHINGNENENELKMIDNLLNDKDSFALSVMKYCDSLVKNK